jgi:hypothetical protein
MRVADMMVHDLMGRRTIQEGVVLLAACAGQMRSLLKLTGEKSRFRFGKIIMLPHVFRDSYSMLL